MKNTISLILLVKNGMKFLPKLLEVLQNQKSVAPFEMIIVDSGSIDGSVEYIKQHTINRTPYTVNGIRHTVLDNKNRALNVKIFQIKSNEFGHGKTRNFAVTKTSGEIVVFLSQDALPMSENWLATLIKPLEDRRVVGVFGQQVPWPQTDELEKFFYSRSYPDTGRIMTKNDIESFSSKKLFFSNVNGAVKRDYLIKYPFREDLVMSEDQFWGREVLVAGNKIVYEPKAGVYHSHNYTLRQLFTRYYQSGYSQYQLNLKGQAVQKGAGMAIELLVHLVKTKPYLLPYAMIYELVKGGGFLLGRSGGRIP